MTTTVEHEWRVKPPGRVSTFEFHEHRPRAPHLEQDAHRPRLLRAAEMVRHAANLAYVRGPAEKVGVSDLGCGDGGLLQLLRKYSTIDAWGYDFSPANTAGWPERGVRAEALDVFGKDWEQVRFGRVTVLTEVLEHLDDPHGVLAWVGGNTEFVVASSPWTEDPASPDECHQWVWDQVGYRQMVQDAGFRILRQETVTWSQLVLATRWKVG